MKIGEGSLETISGKVPPELHVMRRNIGFELNSDGDGVLWILTQEYYKWGERDAMNVPKDTTNDSDVVWTQLEM